MQVRSALRNYASTTHPRRPDGTRLMKMCYVLKRGAKKKHCFALAGHEDCPRNSTEPRPSESFALMKNTRWFIGATGAYLFDGRRQHNIFPYLTSGGGYNAQ